MNPFLRNAERGLIRLLDWSAFQSAWIFYQQGKQARAWSADKLIVWIVSLRIRNLDVGDCKFHRNELKVNFWDDGRARANKKMFLTSTAIIFVKILIFSIDDRFVNYIAINESHSSWRWSRQMPIYGHLCRLNETRTKIVGNWVIFCRFCHFIKQRIINPNTLFTVNEKQRSAWALYYDSLVFFLPLV